MLLLLYILYYYTFNFCKSTAHENNNYYEEYAGDQGI